MIKPREQIEDENNTIEQLQSEIKRLEHALSRIFDYSEEAPELNLDNYDEQQVAKLNDCMIDVWAVINDVEFEYIAAHPQKESEG